MPQNIRRIYISVLSIRARLIIEEIFVTSTSSRAQRNARVSLSRLYINRSHLFHREFSADFAISLHYENPERFKESEDDGLGLTVRKD